MLMYIIQLIKVYLESIKLFVPVGIRGISRGINQEYQNINFEISGVEGVAPISLSHFNVFQKEQRDKRVKEELSKSVIEHKFTNVTLEPKDSYREGFNLKAGRSYMSMPRPDTYIISGEVTYKKKPNVVNSSTGTEAEMREYYRQIDISVSIFPSLESMLVGTIAGSILGTIVAIYSKEIKEPSKILGIVIQNIIFAFMIGIILMRKKDVQPFLTIEDFWGGILIGFLAGYTGQGLFQQLSSLLTSSTNSTDTGGNS